MSQIPWKTLICWRGGSRCCHFHNWDIHRIRHLPLSTATAFANSLVSSKLDYCNSLYSGISQTNLNKLQRIQNSLARVITNTSQYQHITPTLKNYTGFLSNKESITKSVFSHTKHLQINNLHIFTIVFHFHHILFQHDLQNTPLQNCIPSLGSFPSPLTVFPDFDSCYSHFMPYRMTSSVRHRAIEVHYYYFYYVDQSNVPGWETTIHKFTTIHNDEWMNELILHCDIVPPLKDVFRMTSSGIR